MAFMCLLCYCEDSSAQLWNILGLMYQWTRSSEPPLHCCSQINKSYSSILGAAQLLCDRLDLDRQEFSVCTGTQNFC